MLRLLNRWLAGCLALLIAAGAQTAEPRFESIGDASRIPDGVVTALTQDRSGLLWIGSSAGLLRYDGYELRAVEMPGAGGGISASAPGPRRGTSFVRSLLAAGDGSLWVGTDSAGLARFDPAQERWTQLDSAGATVRALAQDSSGRVWVGTLGAGLIAYDSQQRQQARLGTAQGLPDARIQALLVDARGDLWVGSWNGLARCRLAEARCEPVFSAPGAEGLAGQVVSLLGEAGDGSLWVGTRSGDLARIELGDGSARWLDRGGSSGRSASAYYALARLDKGEGAEIWLGRTAGIERRRVSDGALLQLLRRDPRKPWGLGANSVATLWRDHAGWMWVGTFGGGLQRHNANDSGLSMLRQLETADGQLLEADVRSMAVLRNGQVWLGLPEQGVALLDAQLRPLGMLKPGGPGPGGFSGGLIGAIAEAEDGSVWVGNDARLYRFSATQRLLGSQTVGRGRIRRLLPGPAGQLWIGTEDGLFRRDATGSLQRLDLADARPLGGNINTLLGTPDGALWVGSEFGLYRLAPGSGALSEAGAELPRSSVLGLLLDARQQLWVDTNAGLFRARDWRRSDGGGYEAVAEQLGFGGQTFGANLLSDARGRLWTQRAMFDPQQRSFYALTPQDGADLGTSWFRSYAQLPDGRLLFGGSAGLLVVEPERFRPWTFAPPLALTALRIGGQRVARGSADAPLSLAPGQALTAEFAALDFSSPLSNRYRYRLEGRDSDWIEVEPGYRAVSLSGLAPGEYRLRVQGSNRAGAWSPQELSLPISQQPAWWQSAWGQVLTLVALLLAMTAVVQLRTRFLQRRQHELEAKVRERTEALEAVSAQLREKSLALEEASLSDPLTGLRNRRFLAQQIDAEVARVLRQHEEAQRQGQAPAPDSDLLFFLLDMDYFKTINDRWGHAAGDAVLRQMRARLEAVFRETDYLVRWGGEEFLIVARGSTRAHAPELAERARLAVSGQAFELGAAGQSLAISCSIGFAAFPLQSSQPRALDWAATLGLADAALYQAKQQGRNRWVGVLAPARPAEAELLRQGARAPAQWLDSGTLQVVRSAPGT